jgi:hypothetical protein
MILAVTDAEVQAAARDTFQGRQPAIAEIGEVKK